MTNLQTISPIRAAELVREGAVLIDIREVDEHAREHIPGARHHALSRIDAESPIRNVDDVLIFYCRSGARNKGQRYPALRRIAELRNVHSPRRGLDAWRKAGLPVTIDRSQPIDIMRQVQIVAGSLALLGIVLGVLVAPGFNVLSGFVGAGLIFAGTTGFCGMARFLAFMPWNRRSH